MDTLISVLTITVHTLSTKVILEHFIHPHTSHTLFIAIKPEALVENVGFHTKFILNWDESDIERRWSIAYADIDTRIFKRNLKQRKSRILLAKNQSDFVEKMYLSSNNNTFLFRREAIPFSQMYDFDLAPKVLHFRSPFTHLPSRKKNGTSAVAPHQKAEA